MDDDLAVGVLGPLEVTRAGASVGLGGVKPQLLLAMLVTHRNAVVSSSRLCEVLWRDAQPPSASASLQSHISRLRSLVSPAIAITARPSGYCLEMSNEVLDATRFEALTSRARTAYGPEEASCALAEALALWRGEPYGDLGALEWFQGEARRLEELRLGATEDWLEARLACGDGAGVIGDLESLVTQHPLRERFWCQLMTALYQTGRQADALRRGSTLRMLLRDESGLDPSTEFKSLEARILAEDRTLERSEPSPVATARRRDGQHPLAEPTSLVGRAHAVVELVSALNEHRLVTVTGPGGVGKTRVVRRAAAETAARFRHGMVMVELAALRDAAGMGQVIAAALDIQQRQHRSIDETVLEFLAERELLLVLDNCEHLIDTAAGIVERILLRCPSVSVLTTSREPLRLAGEYLQVLAPLATPPASVTDVAEIATAPAVRLFMDRASTASPGFELTADNVTVVAEICRRLDGLPLALELAAARLRALGPTVLASRLDHRFKLLGSIRHLVDARQRTLHELVAWSHDLLNPTERGVFAQLSVFAGTFDVEDAGALCRLDDDTDADRGDVIDVLADLVDKSMVQLTNPENPRYHLLETLREFGHHRLDDAGTRSQIEHRHLRWYLELARQGRIGLDGPGEPAWSRRLHQELDNFRAAHAYAVRVADVDAAASLVRDLHEHAFRHIRYEVSSWADTTLELLAGEEHPLSSVVLAVSAYGRWVRGDLESAIELAQHASKLQHHLPDAEQTGLPERVLGNALFFLGRQDEAVSSMDRMVEIARRRDSAPELAHALYMRSVAHTSVGDPIRGAALAGEASAAGRRCGSSTAAAQAEYALGLALQASDPAAAVVHLRKSAAHAETAGNRWLNCFALTEVHWHVARDEDLVEGLRGYAGVIDTWYRGGDWANQWLSLRHVLGILTELGEHHPAAVLYGALTATGAAYALPYEPGDAERLDRDMVTVRKLLGPADFATRTRQGTAMSDDQVVTYTLDQIARLTAPDG